MKHFTSIQTIRSVAKGSWGKPFENEAAAESDIANDPQNMTAFALLSLVNRAEEFIATFSDHILRQHSRAVNEYYCESRGRKLDEMFKKHGHAPWELVEYWDDDYQRRIGNALLYQRTGCGREYDYITSRPPPGTELRRIYDRWKRRRVKPVKPVEANGKPKPEADLTAKMNKAFAEAIHRGP
jgi:hypothetical protein